MFPKGSIKIAAILCVLALILFVKSEIEYQNKKAKFPKEQNYELVFETWLGEPRFHIATDYTDDYSYIRAISRNIAQSLSNQSRSVTHIFSSSYYAEKFDEIMDNVVVPIATKNDAFRHLKYKVVQEGKEFAIYRNNGGDWILLDEYLRITGK